MCNAKPKLYRNMQACPRTWTEKQENDKLLMEIVLSLCTSDLKKLLIVYNQRCIWALFIFPLFICQYLLAQMFLFNSNFHQVSQGRAWTIVWVPSYLW